MTRAYLGYETREVVGRVGWAGTVEGTGSGLAAAAPFDGTSRARNARAAMRDDTLAPSCIGSLQEYITS